MKNWSNQRGISLPTVYRTIDILKRIGVIKEYNSRRIFKEMIQQRDYLESVYKDNIEDITIVMTGICNNCNGKE